MRRRSRRRPRSRSCLLERKSRRRPIRLNEDIALRQGNRRPPRDAPAHHPSPIDPMRPGPLPRLVLIAALPVLLAGCAGGAAGAFANAALGLVGLGKPPAEPPDAQKPPRDVAIRLHAGANLNADADGRGLALVARVYKLRQSAAFERAPYDSFLDARREREALGGDLLEVKELLLVPGQRYEVLEKVSKEAYFIGVVALFRAPAARRWRLAFAAGEAERSGITVGVHACALSVGAGSAGAGADLRTLSSVRCGEPLRAGD